MKKPRLFSCFSFEIFCASTLFCATAFAQQYQAVILPRPAPYLYAYGEGAGNGRQTGWAIPEGGNYQADIRALLWLNGQAPQDITPTGFRGARIDDAEGDQIVGSVSNNPGQAFSPLAFLWQNAGSTRVLLHPGDPYQRSEAL